MEQYFKEAHTELMLSYRHAFHAGNAADVLKHSVLVFCIDYLLQKETPVLCVDTHAGAGRYVLREGYTAQGREWENGVGKLFGGATAGNGANGKPLPGMIRRFLELCFPAGEGTAGAAPEVYPGSPLLMSRLLRPADRLVCFELHPADYEECKAVLPRHAEVRQEDSFAALKSLLPPPSRRGIVFIDPSYEVKDDYVRLPEIIAMSLKRFSGGVYIVWYPLLGKPPTEIAAAMPGQLMGLYKGNRCRLEFRSTEIDASPANSPRGMHGSGIIIYNPPWTLKPALEETLPMLDTLIGTGKGGWKIEFFE